MNDLVTIHELAAEAGLTTSALTRQCRLGGIPARRFGNQWLITRADAEAFLARLPLPVGWPAQRKNRTPIVPLLAGLPTYAPAELFHVTADRGSNADSQCPDAGLVGG